MKVTNQMIRDYCKRMGYQLVSINKIGFAYQKPNGEMAALLKAAAYNSKIQPTEKSG